jgi:hypothetical protein
LTRKERFGTHGALDRGANMALADRLDLWHADGKRAHSAPSLQL